MNSSVEDDVKDWCSFIRICKKQKYWWANIMNDELVHTDKQIRSIVCYILNKISYFILVSCPSEKSHHHTLTWPETLIGHSASPEEECFTENGQPLERKCLADFNTSEIWKWSTLGKGCASFSSAVTVSLRKLAKSNVTEENILNSSLIVEDITTHYENFSDTDVKYVARFLQNIASVPDIQPEVVISVLIIVDTVIDVEIQVLSDRDSLSADSSKISSALENILTNVQTNGQVITEARNSIAVSALPLNNNLSLIPAGGVLEHWGSNITTLFNDSNKDPSAQFNKFEYFEAAVLLPDNLLAQNRSDDGMNIPIIIRRNFHFLRDVEKNVQVISPVIDVSFGIKPVHNITPPVEMVFNISEAIGNYPKCFKCVFWAADRKIWSDEGCYSKLINITRVHCFCDHLTSFAVIVDLKVGAETNDFHHEILSIMTYSGSCLSIFGLAMVFLTFIVFRKWRAELKHKIIFNLSLALALFLFAFLVGVEKKHWNNGCMAISILLHFSVLAIFTWMLIEAYFQYLRLVKVIGTYIPRFLQKALLFGWGLSWLFGFLAVGETKLVFQYLFTITTTPQRFLIFFFFIYRRKSARDEWVKLLKVSSLSESFQNGGTGMEERIQDKAVCKEANRISQMND
ncbi:adhesion G-protein coupled receptor G2-like [Argiope bruennichi]|uniref:adhesion G-protein coupled receptor G2-like n=1 Tax=Argiope bruennichi TaxID=94029 RepID=UPI002493FE07|nr:adhesion G-protein coupled receptor G2-like [Argiope bruennichi]